MAHRVTQGRETAPRWHCFRPLHLAFSLPSRNVGYFDQGYDRKAIGMASTRKSYGGRGCASDIRAAEVPADYKAKARKADREFSGSGYVRNEPPDPVLTLLRSMPPTTGLVVGTQGELSRSVKQFVSDCAEKGLISP